jgi:hypothetical protein
MCVALNEVSVLIFSDADAILTFSPGAFVYVSVASMLVISMEVVYSMYPI